MSDIELVKFIVELLKIIIILYISESRQFDKTIV